MKKIRLIIKTAIITAIFTLVLLLVFFGTDLLKPHFGGLVKVTAQSTTETLLKLAGPRESLDIAGMTVKTVFPHDLFPEGYNWKALLARRNGPLGIEEKRLVELHDAAKELKMDLTRPVRNFIVLTYDINYGIPLDPALISFVILPVQSEPDREKIILSLPAPHITSVVQRDMTEEGYAYPALPVSPAGIAVITSIAHEYAVRTAIERGLETAARERGLMVLTALMKALGFEEVEIRYSHPDA